MFVTKNRVDLSTVLLLMAVFFVTACGPPGPRALVQGRKFLEAGQTDAALKELKIALEYSPYNNRTYNNLGAVYFDLKQYQNAIDSYKKSLVYVPEFETVQKNLAMTYYFAGDYAACIETMGKFKTEGDQVMINVLNDAKKKLGEKK